MLDSSEINDMKTFPVFFLTVALCTLAGGVPDLQGQPVGPLYKAAPNLEASPRHGPRKGLDSIRRWNQIAIDASGIDHATAKEQLGPGRAARAMAIVHIAMFDTVNAVERDYASF